MSILIATPCYGGMVTEGYLRSCLALRKELLAVGIEHDWLTIANESLVQRARNVIAASFLRETEFSALLFIDADIEFEPAGVARLWNLVADGADVAVGAYRMKRPGAGLAAWRGGKLVEIGEKDVRPFEVDYAGTGFMMISRKTLEIIIEKQPQIEHEEGQIGKCWAFFDCGVVDDGAGPFYVSEDYHFSRTVRKFGMKIMLDPQISLKHHGQAVY